MIVCIGIKFVKISAPVPADMVPILAKTKEPVKSGMTESVSTTTVSTKAPTSKNPEPLTLEDLGRRSRSGLKPKIAMQIQEIPAFGRFAQKPPAVAIPATADVPVPQVGNAPGMMPTVSQTPSEAGSATAGKLRPTASTFVFKPNPKAPTFLPVSVVCLELSSKAKVRLTIILLLRLDRRKERYPGVQSRPCHDLLRQSRYVTLQGRQIASDVCSPIADPAESRSLNTGETCRPNDSTCDQSRHIYWRNETASRASTSTGISSRNESILHECVYQEESRC